MNRCEPNRALSGGQQSDTLRRTVNKAGVSCGYFCSRLPAAEHDRIFDCREKPLIEREAVKRGNEMLRDKRHRNRRGKPT